MKVEWKVKMDVRRVAPPVRGSIGEILRLVADAARVEWIKVARSGLKTTAREYIEGITVPDVRGNIATIRLRGWLPCALEEGHPPFDMKRGLLRGEKAKRDERGRPYVTVPFGLKSYGAMGTSPPVMPKPIYQMAKKLEWGEGLKLPRRYEGWGLRTRLSPDLRKWSHYTWKTSPFQGVVRVRRWAGMPLTTWAGRRAAYLTFRRVSRKSDPSSWIHPGFRARNFLEEAAGRLDDIFPEIVNRVLVG